MFHTFVGIDQTGAKLGKGAKPLYACLTDGKRLATALPLKSLNRSCLETLIDSQGFSTKRAFILVDSCLGVPAPCNTGSRDLIEKAKSFSHLGETYGSITAEQFFLSLLPPSNSSRKKILHRQCELLAKANSPFLRKPYQRNIGCGSYRILKDLAEDTRGLSLWPQEKLKSWVVAEGYPTLAWQMFASHPQKYLEKQISRKLTTLSEDYADACLLAWQAFRFKDFLKRPLPPIAQKEGWIFGLKARLPKRKEKSKKSHEPL